MGRALLFLTTGMIILFGVVQNGIQDKIIYAEERSTAYFEKLQARNIANSLIERGIREIKDNLGWRNGISASSYLSGSGVLNVYDNTSDSTLDQYQLRLASTGTVGNTSIQVQVTLRRTSFSTYSYFTDKEPGIYFITGDTINGPLHTNGQLHISGNPVFTGRVSSPNMWKGKGDPEFLGGSDFGASEVSLPTNLDELKNAAANGGLQLNKTSKLVFKDDGTVEVYTESHHWGFGGSTWEGPDVYNLADINGVISSSDELHIEGVVKGGVSVHSTDDIIIDGDVTYATDPRDDPTSNDFLGIVGEHKVIVSRYAQKANGSQDLYIDASIMALGNSFTVENYGSGGPRGSLNILGGVIQEVRGAVGTFISGGSRPILHSGYRKVYTYDERLLTRWPPHFPVSDQYSVLAWRE